MEDPAHLSEEDVQHADDNEDKEAAAEDNWRLNKEFQGSSECLSQLGDKTLFRAVIVRAIDGALERWSMCLSQHDETADQRKTSLCAC